MTAFAAHPGVETLHDSVLVVGADHLLDGDDGVGAYVVGKLRETPWPENIKFVDGGGNALHLLDLMRSAPRVILIDAVCDGLWPGSVSRHRLTGPADIPGSLAERDTGLGQLLTSLTALDAMPECEVITISVDEMRAPGEMRSSDIAAAVPGVSRVLREFIR